MCLRACVQSQHPCECLCAQPACAQVPACAFLCATHTHTHARHGALLAVLWKLPPYQSEKQSSLHAMPLRLCGNSITRPSQGPANSFQTANLKIDQRKLGKTKLFRSINIDSPPPFKRVQPGAVPFGDDSRPAHLKTRQTKRRCPKVGPNGERHERRDGTTTFSAVEQRDVLSFIVNVMIEHNVHMVCTGLYQSQLD